jgi:RNA polymerase sigma factor for flagellar operon FliA
MLAQESEFSETEMDSLPDTVAPTPAQTSEVEDLRLNLRGALQRLSVAQAAVLYRYYFDDATLDDIAIEMGISKERVRQIRVAGQKKLRADFIVLAIWESIFSRSRE